MPEISRLNARRSLVAARKINKGSVIRAVDLTWKRPAHGISPKDIRLVAGKTAKEDIWEDQVLDWGYIE